LKIEKFCYRTLSNERAQAGRENVVTLYL